MDGPKSAYESKQFSDGGIFLRINMPNIPDDKFTLTMENDCCVTVIGRAHVVIYGSNGHEYIGNRVGFIVRWALWTLARPVKNNSRASVDGEKAIRALSTLAVRRS
ncbi:hypothetical protein YC2023_075553 [Brassica napus]